jgi:hypothetical protein
MRDVSFAYFCKATCCYHDTARGLEPMYMFIAGVKVYMGTKTTHCLETI